MTEVQPRDEKLIADLILKATYLQPGEAFDIGGVDGIILARSSSGKLWIGHGGINSGYTRWWKKGDPLRLLAADCRASLNVSRQGHFASDFRKRCEYALERPARRVIGIGRQAVHIDPEYCEHPQIRRRTDGRLFCAACHTPRD